MHCAIDLFNRLFLEPFSHFDSPLFGRPGSAGFGGKGTANGSIRSEDEIDGDNINVVVRVRPLNSREIKNDDLSIVQFPGDGGIWVRIGLENCTKLIIILRRLLFLSSSRRKRRTS